MKSIPSAAEVPLHAARLWRAAAAVLAALPLAMTIANRSAPLVLSIAAALALLALAIEGEWQELRRRTAEALASSLGFTLIALALYAAMSVLWSPRPAVSLQALGEFALPLAATFVLAILLPGRAPRFAFAALAAALALAALLIMVELGTGLAARRSLGLRFRADVFNRSALTLLILLPPVIWGCRDKRWLASGAAALAMAAVLQSYSEAAALGLALGGAAFAVALLRPRLAVILAALGITAALALAPVMGDVLERAIPPALHERLAAAHSQARIDIWRSFGAVVERQPWFGAGFGPGTTFLETPGAAGIDPAYRHYLVAGHPHNAALQIWTELGAVGVMLTGLALLLALRLLSGRTAEDLAPRLAVMASAGAVSLVGHSPWQGWWPAVIGAAIVWFRIADAQRRPSERSTP